MPDLVTLQEIEGAAERLSGVAVRTPLVPLRGSAPSAPLLLKPESLQPVGSFKLRGAYAAISALAVKERKNGVIAHSSGNHAQAVAYAANAVGIPAVLVVPHTVPKVKADACRALGAELVFVEPSIEARVETTDRLAEAHGYSVIPPFDDRRVIAGQGTIGLEILADDPEVDAVFVPISGGGLIAGVAAAVKRTRPETRVIGVEPELAADAQASFEAGRLVGWPAVDTRRTIADALRVERLGELPFAHVRELVDDVITVTEDEIRAAMRALARRAGLVSEPAGAVAAAAHLSRFAAPGGRHRGGRPRRHVAIVSGGNVDPELFAEIMVGGEPAGTPVPARH